MLVLTRRAGEAIRIGEDVVVYVTGINDSQVKVAIEAPDDVRILREELLKYPARERSARSDAR
jgi:carbon storage regulator